MQRQPTVWIVGAGILQTYLIEEAQDMGLCVLATDGDKDAPGFAIADECYVMSTYDIRGHIDLAKKVESQYPDKAIIGVCTAGADVAPTVAHIAQTLKLPGIPPDVADRSHDKSRVRTCLSLAHDTIQYQPRWKNASVCDTLDQMIDGIGFPAIIKPYSQRASRGVSLVRTYAELMKGVNKLKIYGDRFLVEELLEGTEHSAEILMSEKGDVVYYNITDRIFTYNNGIALEIGAISPTNLSQELCAAIKDMLLRSARVIDVCQGPWKCDVMVTSNGPKILECTARLSGGFDSQCLAPLTERYPLKLLLQFSCNLDEKYSPSSYMDDADGYAAVCTILPRKSGRIISLSHADGAAVRGMLDEDTDTCQIIWAVKPSDVVAPPTHLGERMGFVIVHGQRYASTLASAERAAKTLAWSIEIAS